MFNRHFGADAATHGLFSELEREFHVNNDKTYSRLIRQKGLPALAIGLLLTLAACGGSSSGEAGNPTAPGGNDPDTGVNGPVTLNWTPPAKRENGDELDITELGGYEIRYRSDEDPDYNTVVISDPWSTDYYFDWLEGNYQFQIAAFDNTGLYSDFVELQIDE
jgi:hypothetical protein